MKQIGISQRIQTLDSYKQIKCSFAGDRMRKIGKYLEIPRGDVTYLVNTFFVRKIVKLHREDAARVFNLFERPLSFNAFLHKVIKEFGLDLSRPDGYTVDIVDEQLRFVELLFRKKFIVSECYNEHSQLSRYRKRAISQLNCPRAIYILTTLDCNFRCPGCCVYGDHTSRRMTRMMTRAVLNRQLKFAFNYITSRSHDPISIKFFGSEPLLNKPIVEYAARKIRSLHKNGKLDVRDVFLSITTNGSLLDDNTAKMLHTYDVATVVSMDGVGKSNDQHRVFKNGKGTFDVILKGIDVLRRNDISFSISWTVGPKNIDAVPRDLEWVAKHLGGPEIFFNFMLGSGKFGDPFRKLSDAVFFEKLNAIYDKIRELGLKEGRILRYIDWARAGSVPFHFYCAAVHSGQFALRPDGKIGVCHNAFLDVNDAQYRFPADIGDYADDPMFLEWRGRSPLFIKNCYQNCNYVTFCPGGCARRIEEVAGDKYAVAEEICRIQRFLIERGIIEVCEMNAQ